MTLSLSEKQAKGPPSSPRTRPRVVRVALAGCGAVGGELVRLLHHGAPEIAARYGVRFELVRVLVRGSSRPRPGELSPGILTRDVDAFLATEADVVVEAIGGLDPATRIARGALAAGRRLVTANKALVAAHGPELVRRARRGRGRLDFESAVAGGIPVLRAIRDHLPITGIHAVRGILNGTTNYILTRLAEGRSYAEALAEAQANGFAEADPSRDVSGGDAADKIRILAWLAFGVDPATLPVRTRGIQSDPDRLARDAAALGGVPRLVAECVRTEEGIAAAVEPVIVAASSELGQVRGADNVVVLESRWNGSLRLAGPGAGGGPTASALLGDLLRSARPLRLRARPAPSERPDPRPHRWVVSVVGDQAQERFLRTLARAGVAAEGVARTRDGARAVLGPAPWHRVDLALRALDAAGLAPLASRIQDHPRAGTTPSLPAIDPLTAPEG